MPDRMTRAWLLVALACAMALSASVAHAANAFVNMKDASFQPPGVTINAGESVTWTNQDGIAHSAKADNGAFDTGIFSTSSRTVTISAPGTYGYFCAVHPTTMRGTVNVLGQATPPPTPPPPPPPTVAPTPRPATPVPTAPPTLAPTVVPTRSPTPSPTPSATPTEAPTPSPTVAAAQVTPSPTPTATASPAATSRSGDGAPNPLVLGAVAAAAGLAGLGIYLARRGR